MDRVCFDYQCVKFKIDKALMYQILSKVFMDMHAYVNKKQRNSMQDGNTVYFNIHKQFLGPNHVVRQAVEAERNLQTFH